MSLRKIDGCREYLGASTGGWCEAARSNGTDFCAEHLEERVAWRRRMRGAR